MSRGNYRLIYIFTSDIMLRVGELMPTSEAQKRASKKWDASRDIITIKLEKETGAAIRAAAAAAALSVTQYILDAIQNGGGASLPVDYTAITTHIQKTGESFESFVNRAVKDTIDRDNALIKMGMHLGGKK